MWSARRSSVRAGTPLVSAVPITDEGEAHRTNARREQMRARGVSHSATAVSDLYHRFAATFVLDRADASERASIEANDQRVVLADTIISEDPVGRHLAGTLLAAVG